MPQQDKISGELNRVPGLICPQCGFRIQVTIELLLYNPSIRCSKCSLELTMDQERSKPALNALQKLYDGIKETKGIKAAAWVDTEPQSEISDKPKR